MGIPVSFGKRKKQNQINKLESSERTAERWNQSDGTRGVKPDQSHQSDETGLESGRSRCKKMMKDSIDLHTVTA
jgi:hypothetical protein